MDVENICITCLSAGVLSPLFTMTHVVKDSSPNFLDMLKFCYDKYIYMTENYPQNICNECIKNLEISYNFLKQCEQSCTKISEYVTNDKKCIEKAELCKSTSEDKVGDDLNLKQGNNKNTIDSDDTFNDNGDLTIDRNENCEDVNEILTKKKKVKKRKEDKEIKKAEEILEKDYFCELCQKIVKNKILHKLRVHGERRVLQCDQCSAIFVKPYSLSLHIRQHDNNLPYVCTHPGCNRGFPIPSLLKQHIFSHSDERQFVCQYCSHAARTKQQLLIHIRYHHTKEKKFICSFCSKGFVSSQARYNHEKRHKNIRDYACQYCDKTFVSRSNLVSHTLTHTGVKNFACRLCETKFSRKDHRNKHETNVHGVANINQEIKTVEGQKRTEKLK